MDRLYSFAFVFALTVFSLLMVFAPARLSADVRRAQRWNGLLEMYKPKTPWPRCITHRTYRVPRNRYAGEVMLDDRLLFRMVMKAGGFRVEQRAEIVARRLERLLEMKSAFEEVHVENWRGQWVVTLGGSIVITAATGTSLHYRMSRRELANRWADSLRTTLHNALGPGAQNLRGDPPVEKIQLTMPPWDDRYRAIIKGDKAYARGEFEVAATWYRKSLVEDPSAYDGHHKLGMALEKLGKSEDAKEEYIACLELRPDYAPARRKLYELDKRVQAY